jgi:hypothetical protein
MFVHSLLEDAFRVELPAPARRAYYLGTYPPFLSGVLVSLLSKTLNVCYRFYLG